MPDDLLSSQCGCANHYVHDFPAPLEAEIPTIEADIEKREQRIRGLRNHIASRMESQLAQDERDRDILKSIIEPRQLLRISQSQLALEHQSSLPEMATDFDLVSTNVTRLLDWSRQGKIAGAGPSTLQFIPPGRQSAL
ncbi:hypothetical protein C8J56DRAFT_1168191 [Mycena floridula]|nr:hypothetical protein C8J56DRAFT_1168191 [Mycena floridula]